MKTVTKKHLEHESIATANPFPRSLAARSMQLRSEQGQGFAEYALILSLVVLVGMTGLSPFGVSLASLMVNTISALVAFL